MSLESKLIDNYIYLYHLDKFVLIPQYPDQITDNMGSNFTSTNALGRSAPVFSYNDSGPRTVQLSFTLHRDMMEDLNRNVSNLKDNVVDFSGDDYVDTLIKHLQAIALPRYNIYSSGSKSIIPPMVAVRLGNDIFVKGVVSSGISVTYQKPILWNNKYAIVTVGFTVSEVDPYSADDVLSQGSFRGITSTFKDGIYSSTSSSPMYTQSSVSNSGSSGLVDKSTTLVNRFGIKTSKNKQIDSGSTKIIPGSKAIY